MNFRIRSRMISVIIILAIFAEETEVVAARRSGKSRPTSRRNKPSIPSPRPQNHVPEPSAPKYSQINDGAQPPAPGWSIPNQPGSQASAMPSSFNLQHNSQTSHSAGAPPPGWVIPNQQGSQGSAFPGMTHTSGNNFAVPPAAGAAAGAGWAMPNQPGLPGTGFSNTAYSPFGQANNYAYPASSSNWFGRSGSGFSNGAGHLLGSLSMYGYNRPHSSFFPSMPMIIPIVINRPRYGTWHNSNTTEHSALKNSTESSNITTLKLPQGIALANQSAVLVGHLGNATPPYFIFYEIVLDGNRTESSGILSYLEFGVRHYPLHIQNATLLVYKTESKLATETDSATKTLIEKPIQLRKLEYECFLVNDSFVNATVSNNTCST